MTEAEQQRLEWLAANPDPGARPPEGLWGRTTWPQEMSSAVQAALAEIDRLIEVVERQQQGMFP